MVAAKSAEASVETAWLGAAFRRGYGFAISRTIRADSAPTLPPPSSPSPTPGRVASTAQLGGLSADLGLDLPVLMNTTKLQAVPGVSAKLRFSLKTRQGLVSTVDTLDAIIDSRRLLLEPRLIHHLVEGDANTSFHRTIKLEQPELLVSVDCGNSTVRESIA